MLVANSFDLWRKDDFFSAAEEVQQSADIMESMYRMWVRGKREREENLDYSQESLRGELQIALATAKWQLDEFERAVRLSHGFRSQDNTSSRHKQFIDVLEAQISRVERDLRESLAEEKQPLRWVNLDEQESDDLEAFLSGTSSSLETSSSGDSIELEPPQDIIGLESNCIPSCKEVVTINKESKYVIELQAKEIPSPRARNDTNCQADRVENQTRTWSSPNFGSWKIVIADEGEQKETLDMGVESTNKGKAFDSDSSLWRQKGRTRLQNKGLISNCLDLRAKLFKRMSGAQRQLQGPHRVQLNRFLQVMLLVMLTIFFIVPMVVYTSY